MIVLTGATGNVGGNVVRQLLDAGERVRAVTRSPGAARLPDGVEVVGGERAVRNSGLDWTFVRPGGFATNTLSWAPSVRAEGVARAPYPGATVNLIHEADIAAVATTALLEDGHGGARYPLTGPESMTQAEQVQAIGAAIGRDVRFEEQSPEQARRAMVRYMPEPIADIVLNYWADSVGSTAPVLPTVEQVTGRPARSYPEWAVDPAEDFGASS
jgi:uncharacterized protein YbjT (DUF2867 family)